MNNIYHGKNICEKIRICFLILIMYRIIRKKQIYCFIQQMLYFHREFLNREVKIIGLCGNEDWQIIVPHAIFKTLTFPDQNSSPPRLGPRPRTFFLCQCQLNLFLNYTKYIRHKHNALIIIIKLRWLILDF